MKKKLFCVLITAAVFCGCGGMKNESADLISPSARQTAPGFELMTLDGQMVSLESLKGKVVLLDFWATWCPPCRMSIPALIEFYEEYKSSGVEVVGISVDQNPSVVSDFAQKKEIPYMVLLGTDGRAAQEYGVRGIPTFFAVDQKGRIAQKWVGFDASYERQWRKTIGRLLTE